MWKVMDSLRLPKRMRSFASFLMVFNALLSCAKNWSKSLLKLVYLSMLMKRPKLSMGEVLNVKSSAFKRFFFWNLHKLSKMYIRYAYTVLSVTAHMVIMACTWSMHYRSCSRGAGSNPASNPNIVFFLHFFLQT